MAVGEHSVVLEHVPKEIRNENQWLSAPVFESLSVGNMFPALDKKIQIFRVCAGNFPALVQHFTLVCRKFSCIL